MPSCSTGFCVANTVNRSPSGRETPSTVTWRSCHRLEQCGLRLRRCAVDLVGEQEIGEHGPGLELEAARRIAEDVHTGDIGRHEVGRELDAREANAERCGEHAREQRLRGTGHAFDEHVSAREERGEDLIDHVVLAEHA